MKQLAQQRSKRVRAQAFTKQLLTYTNYLSSSSCSLKNILVVEQLKQSVGVTRDTDVLLHTRANIRKYTQMMPVNLSRLL